MRLRDGLSRTIHTFNATGAQFYAMTKSDFNLLLRFAKPHGAALTLGATVILIESGFMLLLPYFGGVLAEQLLRDRSGAVRNTLIALFAVITMQALLRFATAYLLGKCAHRLLADMRIALYRHLQSLPMAYFHAKHRGDILSVLLSDVHSIGTYVTSTLVGLLGLMVTLVGSVVFMWKIDSTLAAVGVLAIPAFYLAIKILGRKVRPLAASLSEANWKLFTIAEENLGLIAIIKAFSRESHEARRYDALNETMRSLEDKQLLHAGGLSPAMQWIAGTAMIALLWFASDKVSEQTMGAGALITFLLYASLLTRPVSAIADLYGKTQSVRASLARVKDTFDVPPEAVSTYSIDETCMEKATLDAPTIEFRDVSFAYPGRPPALRNFNLIVASGETIALVGNNGAGKTTLVHLLLRYMNTTEGQILIDGVDIQQLELRTLRKMIGFVPQHVQLLNGSIHDNIAYGAPDASREDVERAARSAQAHEFVTQLPEGYKTVVGDDGVRLSGGQRQRIALARALLMRPAILILDEATSMVDSNGEHALRTIFAELFASKTVIQISHHQSELVADARIVAMY